jgi:cell division protein FtsX
METNYTEQSPKIELLQETIQNLNETRKWTNFLSIMGFIFIGLMILIAFAVSSMMSTMAESESALPFSGTFLGFVYLIIAFIYFFPILYLYRFSKYTKKALETQNSNDLNEAFKNLKSHYRFMGIITIVMIALYAFIFLIGIAVGFTGMM